MERLTARMVADRLGIRPDTWWAYVTRGSAPKPDGREALSGMPWWLPSTIDAYLAGRRSDARVSGLS